MSGRNPNLDLARLLACIGVIGLHCTVPANYTYYYLCTYSVPFFFMISGYLMFAKDNVSFGYAFRKILSYGRIIIMWNILIAVPVMIFRHKLINPLTESLKSIFQQGYLWHFWFFGTMIIIYLLLPLFHRFLKSSLTCYMLISGIFFLSCIVITLMSMRFEYYLLFDIPQSLRLNIFIFYFLLGGLLSNAKVKSLFSRPSPYFYGIASLVFCVISNFGQKHLGLYLYHSRLAEYFYGEFLVIIWILLLFLFILYMPFSKISERLKSFKYFPKEQLTLGIFIIHPILLKAIDVLKLPQTNLTAILIWIGLFIASAVISWVLNRIPLIRKLVNL